MGAGPLAGLRVVEVAGAGPTSFGSMVLADLGADVVRVDRSIDRTVLGVSADLLLGRGKRSVGIDLKRPEGVEVLLRLVDTADVFIEGSRPGVAERLGFGPEVCQACNPRLVYARSTGWGQHGPLAPRAGHDIDYIAVAGALAPIGRAGEPPVPPLNLVGDFGGGGMLLAVGVLAALFEVARSGTGQVVDSAMVDGAALLMTAIFEMRALGIWTDGRERNLIDGGSPYYGTYETSDGRYVAVGAMEPQFYAELLRVTGLDTEDGMADQNDVARWPEMRRRLAEKLRTRTRDEWQGLAEGVDACLVPVLELDEVADHRYNTERAVYVDVGGIALPAPAPRFSRTAATTPAPTPERGADTDAVLLGTGFSAEEIDTLRTAGLVG